MEAYFVLRIVYYEKLYFEADSTRGDDDDDAAADVGL